MPDTPLRIIAIGAHPDDCEIFCGGLAWKYVRQGHAVKFVSVTNGNAGHHQDDRETLKRRRIQEAKEAGRILGIEYEVLDYNDGELVPSLALRNDMIRLIREWQADVVFSHRPHDYHPDHRYTGTAVQDSAYLVTVPPLCPQSPPLSHNPYFFYFWDPFQKPYPFQPDIAVDVDEVMDHKWDMMHCHTSQFYEWLPYVEHVAEPVPGSMDDRRQWLPTIWTPWIKRMTECCRKTLVSRYGTEKGKAITFAETFEICEYGTRPNEEDIERLFPK